MKCNEVRSYISSNINYSNEDCIPDEIINHIDICPNCLEYLNYTLNNFEETKFITNQIKKIELKYPSENLNKKIMYKFNIIQNNKIAYESFSTFIYAKILEFRLSFAIYVIILLVLIFSSQRKHEIYKKQNIQPIVQTNLDFDVRSMSQAKLNYTNESLRKLQKLCFLETENHVLRKISFLHELEAYELSKINFEMEEELWLENSEG